MRRPNVYERSAPRVGRPAFHEVHNTSAMARTIAAQLGNMISRADQAGMAELGDLLEHARAKAEKLAQG